MQNETIKRISKNITLLYLGIMMSFFLFYFHNYYFDMTPTKYKFFYYVTLTFLILSLGIAFICIVNSRKNLKNKISALWGNLPKWELFLILMLFSMCLTTLFSQYRDASIWGTSGRQTGLVFMIMVSLMAIVIAHTYDLDQLVILIYLCGTSLVFILAILNFFSIDPFGFFVKLSDYQGGFYLSTIGNINFFSSLICLSLPLSSVLYCYCQQKNSKVIYYLCSILGFISLIIGNSDSGFLGIGIVFIVLFFIFIQDYQCFKRFLQLCISWLVAGRIIGIFIELNPIDARPLITLSSLLSTSTISFIVLIALIIVYWIWKKKKDYLQPETLKKIRNICFCIFVILLLFLIAIIFYVNTMNTKASLGILSTYLRFDENWGTGRGMIWSHLLEAYTKFPLMNKLFGNGLDTTRIIMSTYFPSEGLGMYDNAHNEFIQYLVTSGFIGLSLYLTSCIMLLKGLCHFIKTEPFALGIFSIILCYLVQSVVNINQPITTPLFFIFIGIGGCCIRCFKQEEKLVSANR